MRPESTSRRLLGITQAQAKMIEYEVAPEDRIHIPRDPAVLFDIAIGALGDIAAEVNDEVPTQNGSTEETRATLGFASRPFASYRDSRLRPILDDYTALCASAASYLSDMPGTAQVLCEELATDLKLHANGLERLLLWSLRNEDAALDIPPGKFSEPAEELVRLYRQFCGTGWGSGDLLTAADGLRALADQHVLRLKCRQGSPVGQQLSVEGARVWPAVQVGIDDGHRVDRGIGGKGANLHAPGLRVARLLLHVLLP